nr:pescadillo homolog [Ipomoea batatas]
MGLLVALLSPYYFYGYPEPRGVDFWRAAVSVLDSKEQSTTLCSSPACSNCSPVYLNYTGERPISSSCRNLQRCRSITGMRGKKMEGNAARYITRSQAVKSLQISIYLFRKLCILKAEDQGKSSDISYHTIDNRFLQSLCYLSSLHLVVLSHGREREMFNRRFLLGTCHLVDNEAKAMSLNMLRPSSGYRPLQEKKSLPMQGVRWHRGFG